MPSGGSQLACGRLSKNKQGTDMSDFNIFVIRAILGAAIAVVLGRMFYPEAPIPYVVGLGVILVGLAYFAEYLRNRKKR